PLLATGTLLDRIARRDGFPVLDDALQTTVPGLFVTSLPATRDFGSFFAFTAAVRASARIIGRAIVGAVAAEWQRSALRGNFKQTGRQCGRPRSSFIRAHGQGNDFPCRDRRRCGLTSRHSWPQRQVAFAWFNVPLAAQQGAVSRYQWNRHLRH